MKRRFNVPDPVLAEKRRIRTVIREQRKRLEPEWVRDRSARIQETVTCMNEFKEASMVCCYLALPVEVATEAIIRECRRTGKKVCVPAFNRDSRAYDLALLGPDTALVEGPMRVMEPEDPEWVEMGGVNLMVVPGVAFDGMCRRLGHGGGHYDAILGRWERAKPGKGVAVKIGLAFDFQIFGEIPVLPKDAGMDVVVTEKRTIKRGD